MQWEIDIVQDKAKTMAKNVAQNVAQSSLFNQEDTFVLTNMKWIKRTEKYI